MKRILRRAKRTPSVILCDNGGEFQGDFIEYCDNKHIHIRNTRSHSPTENAVVERVNAEIRKICRDIFVRTGKNNWIKYLPQIEENRNNAFHSGIKNTSSTIWMKNTPMIRMKCKIHIRI